MTDDEKGNYAIPYVLDEDNVKWYLYQIMWANSSSVNRGTAEMVMTCQQIKQAAESQRGDAYKFDLNEITDEPSSSNRYYIRYCWTDVAPEKWEEDISGRKTYDVEFDLNQEALVDLGYAPDASDNWFFGLKYDESLKRYFLDVGDDNPPNLDWVQFNSTSYLKTTVREWSSFTVGKYPTTGHTTSEEYYGYLVFNKTENQYFQFVGWEGEDGETYQFNEIVSPTDELAGGDTTITFKAKWEPIELLTLSLIHI